MRNRIHVLMVMAALLALPVHAEFDPATRKAVTAAIQGDHRDQDNRARDADRQPYQTLEFFGFRSDMTVVEVWPGWGWYTEILAPALKDRGVLYAAQFGVNPRFGYQRRGLGEYLKILGRQPDVYGDVRVTSLRFPQQLEIAPAGTADMVLTFRNVHNWVMKDYGGGRYAGVVFDAMFEALKPGGILGVVDHRWPDPETEDPMSANGYISAERTIKLAQEAGFKLAGRSEHLANSRDDHQHPNGVWTLPPSLAVGDADPAPYQAIGESDRFVLKFVKPLR